MTGLELIGFGAFTPAGSSLLDGSEADGTNILSGGLLDFSSSWGTLNVSLTPNNGLAPNGATEAAQMLETAANDRHGIYASVSFSITAGGSYIWSVYAKAITRRYLQIAVAGSGKIYAYFDLLTGVVTTSGTLTPDGATVVSAVNCQAAVNGFYKCSLAGIVDGVSATPFLQYMTSDVGTYGAPLSSDSPSFTGNTSNGVYLWRPKVA